MSSLSSRRKTKSRRSWADIKKDVNLSSAMDSVKHTLAAAVELEGKPLAVSLHDMMTNRPFTHIENAPKLHASQWKGMQQYVPMLHLARNHSNDCVININANKDNVSWYVKEETLDVDPLLFEQMQQCSTDARFIVVSIELKADRWGQEVTPENHANVLIFDTKNKRMIRFEPHGFSPDEYKPSQLNQSLTDMLHASASTHRRSRRGATSSLTFKDVMGSGWTYEAPSFYCPKDFKPEREVFLRHDPSEGLDYFAPYGVQGLEGMEEFQALLPTYGFCVIHVHWFTDLYMSNPDADLRELFDRSIEIIQENPTAFATFILEYARFFNWVKNRVRSPDQLETYLSKVT